MSSLCLRHRTWARSCEPYRWCAVRFPVPSSGPEVVRPHQECRHMHTGMIGVRYHLPYPGSAPKHEGLTMDELMLPADFLFGTATAAYQVEGAAHVDGRGPSIWDTYCRTSGRVARGETGDVACDHYHRYGEDVELLADLGVDLYRFSVSWPRIQPSGQGRPNPKGLAFYDRLVDSLLEAGIEPVLTLYHWDLPQALEDKGGWRVRETAHRFAEYTRIVADRLGDRVGRWITLNEPFCTAFVGHAVGRHAPGTQEGPPALAVQHHLLLSHGMAVGELRASGKGQVGITLNPDKLLPASVGHAVGRHPPGTQEGTPALAVAHHLLLAHGMAVGELRASGTGQVGITLNPDQLLPASESAADRAAVERARTLHNRVWFDPLFLGTYPDNENKVWGDLADGSYRHEGDLRTIGQPLDFLGVNFYRPIVLRDAPHHEADPARRTAVDIGIEQVPVEGVRHTTMGWPVMPETFTDLLVDLDRRYPDLPPIMITENGSAEVDRADENGRVRDTDRIAYLQEHLNALAKAIDAGVDVSGYFVWSLLDNFEWAFGYDRRFGLVRVDYERLTRHPKDSYHWYRDFLITHRSRRSSERDPRS